MRNGWKTLGDTSWKKIYKCQISIGKDAPYHISSGKCKLEQWVTTTCLLECSISRTTMPDAINSKDVK